MLASQISGWILFAVGVLMYLVSIWRRLQQRTRREESLRDIKDTVKALTELLDAFSKFSEDIQFLLLATGCLVVGIYLLQSKPF